MRQSHGEVQTNEQKGDGQRFTEHDRGRQASEPNNYQATGGRIRQQRCKDVYLRLCIRMGLHSKGSVR